MTGTLILQVLTKANQQFMEKAAEYTDRYRGLKSAMTDKEKQLDLAKRTIERLSGQCNAMEVASAVKLPIKVLTPS